ncbi:hypothetical protein [uncultured Sphingopyxis sp.]|uniref:hypothetical protein n=1 Tax=uncultured Sphingopyxis sp. TaxID=310581 RepID=UPI0025E9B60C|nr:hypothetical protein [uncultured Sphingopyxis sp.]
MKPNGGKLKPNYGLPSGNGAALGEQIGGRKSHICDSSLGIDQRRNRSGASWRCSLFAREIKGEE